MIDYTLINSACDHDSVQGPQAGQQCAAVREAWEAQNKAFRPSLEELKKYALLGESMTPTETLNLLDYIKKLESASGVGE